MADSLKVLQKLAFWSGCKMRQDIFFLHYSYFLFCDTRNRIFFHDCNILPILSPSSSVIFAALLTFNEHKVCAQSRMHSTSHCALSSPTMALRWMFWRKRAALLHGAKSSSNPDNLSVRKIPDCHWRRGDFGFFSSQLYFVHSLAEKLLLHKHWTFQFG